MPLVRAWCLECVAIPIALQWLCVACPVGMALVYVNEIPWTELVEVPGDDKLKEKVDPRGSNASDFIITKEDHTLANLLRMKLHTNRNVKFAGYKVPHVTKHTIEIKVQTAAGADASQRIPKPSEALEQCIDELIADVDHFDAEFNAAMAKFA